MRRRKSKEAADEAPRLAWIVSISTKQFRQATLSTSQIEVDNLSHCVSNVCFVESSMEVIYDWSIKSLEHDKFATLLTDRDDFVSYQFICHKSNF